MLSKTMTYEKSNPTSYIKGIQVSDLESYQEKPTLKKSFPQRVIFARLIPGNGSRARPLFPVKRLALALLVLHNSGLILTLRYSRVVPQQDGKRYLPSTAILQVEVIKLVFSLSIIAYQISENGGPQSVQDLGQQLYQSLFSGDSWKLMIPAALWTLQNSIVYIAISNLDAATFQVTYQLKILTTVFFSITLLGKRISWRQCMALLLLTLGIAIVQAPGAFFESSTLLANLKSRLPTPFIKSSGSSFSPLFEARSATPNESYMLEDGLPERIGTDPSRGFLALFTAAMISGITGVYFEKVLKDSLPSVSIWTRNAQLSFYSIFPALIIGVLWQDGGEIRRSGFFAGYRPLVWATIMLQASGGIIVAICITYADNIEKNFATSISVVLSCFASLWFFDTPLTLSFALGTSLILLAVYLYHKHSR